MPVQPIQPQAEPATFDLLNELTEQLIDPAISAKDMDTLINKALSCEVGTGCGDLTSGCNDVSTVQNRDVMSVPSIDDMECEVSVNTVYSSSLKYSETKISSGISSRMNFSQFV